MRNVKGLLVNTIIAILMLAIILMVVFFIGKTLPYEAVQLDEEDVRIEPISACGGEEVNVTYVLSTDNTVDRITGFTYWVSGDDNRPYSSIFFDSFDPAPTTEEKVEVDGPTRRVAPWPRDYWHAGINATVYGTRWGFIPVEQRIWLESTDTLYTKGRSAEDCRVG